MTTIILSISLFVIFSALGFIHFYWLLGGKWGLKKTIPTKEIEEKAIKIPKTATAIVGIGLISFGFFYLIKSGLIIFQTPKWTISCGSWIIPSIFIIRAIGDFNYVGLFKTIKNTEFAKSDSKWFTPLCLVIGFLGLLIQIVNKY